MVDCVQYSNWTPEILEEVASSGLAGLHVTVAYHGGIQDLLDEIMRWNERFALHANTVLHGRTADDVRLAHAQGRTAILYGLQNPSPIGDDIGLLQICYDLGIRFMQLTYNNQSLLAGGCYEDRDCGVTRMGREVIREMNRLGMVVDMSHSGHQSTFEAIELSDRPIAITHANNANWHPHVRNKNPSLLKALSESGGMLGFSCYTHHLKGGPDCTLDQFCEMIAATADIMGVDHIGIGSDLCKGHGDEVLTWMRNGKWTKSGHVAQFPLQPSWFRSVVQFGELGEGLHRVGFERGEVEQILGLNWLDFFERSFGPQKNGTNVRTSDNLEVAQTKI